LPRPEISLVVPFAGRREDAVALLAALVGVELGPGDGVVVADNGPADAFAGLDLPAWLRLVPARGERSSYFARNVGAEASTAPWLLFVDSDCRPAAGILDHYFAPPPDLRTGVVAGSVRAADGQTSLAAGYARSRGHLDETYHLDAEPYPAGITANLLVRSDAFERIGGFHEGVLSGADVELCWRLQEAGWGLEYRPAATVEHRHPDALRALLRKSARYGAGRRWVNRRYRGAAPRPRVARPLLRAAAGSLAWPLVGRPRRGLFKLIDGAWVLADAWGYIAGDSRAPRAATAHAPAGRAVAVFTDVFPARSETFVYNEALTLRELGWRVSVEASARPASTERPAARALAIDYVEDYWPLGAAGDLAWLATRHPLASARDLLARRRWRRQETVMPLRSIAPTARRVAATGAANLHAHFAAGGALTAMRIGRLLGIPYGVTCHGYDVFQRPTNLEEKLRRARLVIGPCEYTASHLRALLPARRRDRVHVVIAGVDGGAFRRRSPYPGGRTVIAVGRLVEKKGFAYLIEAAAELRRRGSLERLVIVGEGPLRPELEALIDRLDLAGVAELAVAWGAAQVRERLEAADVLAMPSVIAADGDRDAMPVVVKEALAMEVPVVTSDVAGLPEAVGPEWGRMAPPRDGAALAAALAEVLALPADERARMGAAGRRFVLERCELRRETAGLARLLESVSGG
jgi:colanic acid/amylovoran biosynthesis glycosyltransferase